MSYNEDLCFFLSGFGVVAMRKYIGEVLCVVFQMHRVSCVSSVEVARYL